MKTLIDTLIGTFIILLIIWIISLIFRRKINNNFDLWGKGGTIIFFQIVLDATMGVVLAALAIGSIGFLIGTLL